MSREGDYTDNAARERAKVKGLFVAGVAIIGMVGIYNNQIDGWASKPWCLRNFTM
jgi:hypothetical protein